MPSVVHATAFGGPEVLSLADLPAARPGVGQVLIDVRAAGVNPVDVKLYSGAFGTDESQLPMRLGFEAAGVVVEVGADAIGPAGPIAVGDEVIAYQPGAYAQRLLADASAVFPKPAALDWAQAGGLLLTGATAAHLVTATGIAAGDTVLVHGAAGGVGLAAVQLARARGARVIGTASQGRHELLRRFGAEPVSYGDGLLDRVRALAPDGIDAALDTVGTDEAIDVSLALVADRARIATIAAFGRAGAAGIKLLGGGPGADPGEDIRAAARLELVRLAEAGEYEVIVGRAYPLAEVADAHREIAGGHAPGKLVLLP